MSAFTFADNKLGGRIMTACDAIASGKLRTAAGILNEVAEELNVEAEATDGLLSEEVAPVAQPAAPQQATGAQPVDMQMCARNVHSYSAPDPFSGWRTCTICGNVNVAPPQ